MDISNIKLFDIQENREVSLSQYMGKPCMITFWTSWCPDSQRDLVKKNQLFETMDTNKLSFITVNVVGREGNDQDGIRYVKQNQFRFPVLLDEGTKVYDYFQCKGVPTTVLLDKEMTIKKVFDDRSSFIDIMNGLSNVM
ncbi:hypothetical protein BTR23_00375 [Alkalihalophilus pseudofirmus]|nr:hypothetical protein BTR23_00375 [Alkalihalophilus pseudofirmus]